MDIGQRRAKAGGELGANGEWYEGGKFIATRDLPKTAPYSPRPLTPEEIAQREAATAQVARVDAWLAARMPRLVELTEPFLAVPHGMDAARWGMLVESGHAGFEADLARQLRRSGSLTCNQARYFVKFVMGRETKKNTDEWNALFDFVTEQFS